MCGIAGCAVPAGRSPAPATLARMCSTLAHRGGDDSGVEIIENVGLANTRLAIMDPSQGGHQPMADLEGRWALTYNGEIYDHARWRRELVPSRYRGHSDTETLLRALGTLGPAAVERVNGPFALAALDCVNRRLVLARDRLGVKPLYLARHGGAVWFASEIKALLAAGVPARPRRDVLAHAVGRSIPTGRATPFEGVERVPAGTTVSFDLDTLVATERTWFEPADMVDEGLAGELSRVGRAELRARLDAALTAAVSRRMVSDAPVGTMCSGGLDSSLVTSLARDGRESNIAFTVALPDTPRADESAHAGHAARALGVELDVVTITDRDWRAGLVAAVRGHEYPLMRTSSVLIGAMARRARARGVKVVLTGEAADELLGGYSDIHREQHRAFLSSGQRLARGLERARVSGPGAAVRWRVQRVLRRTPSVWVDELLPATAVTSYEDERLAAARRAYGHHPGARGELEAHMLAALSCQGFAYLLNRLDKDAMAHSVETRLPFLDPEVIRLAVNLPLEARVARRTKPLLRDVARPHLPRRIAARPKQAGLRVDSLRAVEAAARPGFLLEGSLREALECPRRVWRDLVARAPSHVGIGLWTGEIWCRLMLEGQEVGQVEEALWKHP